MKGVLITFYIGDSLAKQTIAHLLKKGEKVSKKSVLNICRREFERLGTTFDVEPFVSYYDEYKIDHIEEEEIEKHFKRVWK